MRKYSLVLLIFILTACTLGHVPNKTTSAAAPTLTPSQAVVQNTTVPTATQTVAAIPTNTSTPSQSNAPSNVRRPLGIYAHIDLSNLANDRKKSA